MPQRPDPPTPPPDAADPATAGNELFAKALAAMPSPSGAPTGMSRQELAEAVNAELARRGTGGFITDKDIGRFVRGETRWPRDHYRAALRTVLGVDSDRDLGFYRNRRTATGGDAQPPGAWQAVGSEFANDGPASEWPAILSVASHADSPANGLAFPARWSHAVEVTTGLWRADVERRSVIRNAAFAAAAFVIPALRAVAPADERLVSDGRRVVEEPDIETVRRVTVTLRGLDNQYGGGHIRETAVRFLDADVAPLLSGRFSEPVGRSLMSATAELTQLAGWAAYDAGLHGLGQLYLVQALRLSVAAADRPLSAEILAAMSHQSAYLGAPVEAVDLARAAGRVASEVDIPALVAEAAVLEAHGHAVAGDERECTAALTRAEAALDKADRSRDPAWIGYFDEAYLSAKFGHCFSALRRGELAERFAHRSLDMDDRYVRGRQFNLTLYATAFVARDKPQVDQAAGVAIEAVQVAEGLRSARSVDYVARLADRLAPYCGVHEVAEFQERARPLLRR